MQLSVTTAMTQPSALSLFKQRQERQPNQPLEASVADSFKPSTATAQSRSGANGKISFASFVTGSLLFLTACGQQAVKETTPVVQKTVAAEVAPIVEKQTEKAASTAEKELTPDLIAVIVKRVDGIQADSSIQPISFEPPPTPKNEASVADFVNPRGLSKEKRIEIGSGIIKASKCKEQNGSWLYTLDPNQNAIASYPTKEGCKLGVFRTADTVIIRGRVEMPPDSSVVLKKLINTSEDQGYVLQVNQAPGLTKP
jgi:hypothetical protein